MGFPDYRSEKMPDGSEVFVCVECGEHRFPGDWPQCPHIPGHFGDDPLEPYFDEHISTDGEYITSRGQRRALMSKNRMEFRQKRLDLIPGRKVYFDQGRGR